MKVLCIDAKIININFPEIKEGMTYTSLRQEVGPSGNDCYAIVECNNLLYAKFRFIPCSDIDEREYQTNYEQALNKQP